MTLSLSRNFSTTSRQRRCLMTIQGVALSIYSLVRCYAGVVHLLRRCPLQSMQRFLLRVIANAYRTLQRSPLMRLLSPVVLYLEFVVFLTQPRCMPMLPSKLCMTIIRARPRSNELPVWWSNTTVPQQNTRFFVFLFRFRCLSRQLYSTVAHATRTLGMWLLCCTLTDPPCLPLGTLEPFAPRGWRRTTLWSVDVNPLSRSVRQQSVIPIKDEFHPFPRCVDYVA